jgi:leucyl-tRNA synthetase
VYYVNGLPQMIDATHLLCYQVEKYLPTEDGYRLRERWKFGLGIRLRNAVVNTHLVDHKTIFLWN